MIAFAHIDKDGVPVRLGRGPGLPAGAVALPDGITPEAATTMVRDPASGDWTPRPALPVAQVVAKGFTLDSLPDRAEIVVSDLATGQEMRPAPVRRFTYPLPEQGDFQITVTAPRPWLASEVTVRRGEGSPILNGAALARTRAAALARVNEAIGQVRLRYITEIPGQQTIYTEKQAEARAYLREAPEPASLTDFPLLAAEVGVTAPTAWQLAQIWANKSALWRQVAGATERLRMQASAAIDAAPDEAAIEAAVTTALTTLQSGP